MRALNRVLVRWCVSRAQNCRLRYPTISSRDLIPHPSPACSMKSPEISGILRNRYWLLSELGRGGMGVTYRAWDSIHRVPVVVKMLLESLRKDPATQRRFAQEIQAMLALKHRHIVPIIDHGDDDEMGLFVVMRFLPGGSLADYLGSSPAGETQRSPPGMLHRWLPGIASALDFIHERGVLHRDVKPGNVFLDVFLDPFLGDFGIAKAVDDSLGLLRDRGLTAPLTAIGTVEYMAPEQFTQASRPSGRTDQYALAVTVYKMLSGNTPFTGDSGPIIVEHLTKPVPPLVHLGAAIPESLWLALQRALAKKPEDRFPNCREFAQAALQHVPPSKVEPGIARFLCPSCSTIIRLSTSSAGKAGRCSNCKSAMEVAADLSALSLRSEAIDSNASDVRSASETTISSEMRDELVYVDPPSAKSRWLDFAAAHWRDIAVAAAVVSGLLCATVAWLATDALWQSYHDRQRTEAEDLSTKQLKTEKDLAITNLVAAKADWEKELSAAEDSARIKLEATEDLLKKSAAEKDRLRTANERGAGFPPPGEKPVAAPPVLTSTEILKNLIAVHNAAGERTLTVPGFKKLELNEVELLSEVEGTLILDDLQKLSADAAKKLVAGSSSLSLLSLNGLTVLDDATGRALGQATCSLSLNGLKTFPIEFAKSFKRNAAGTADWRDLYLDGLVTLSEKEANLLAGRNTTHKGDLSLDGLLKINTSVARELALHEGTLSLFGLTFLSQKEADEFEDRVPVLHLDEKKLRDPDPIVENHTVNTLKANKSIKWKPLTRGH